ncbi:MAG: hypothetical protein HRU38_07490 [Saccharospirillaceae bacterium]|nr:hypothetical protein [Pseudomonadales bacterium]NRB78495.1 hypothetical protein [Saccharospirillaceae bacterium]
MTSRILKQMGITKWVSRFQMPNAAKSILIEPEIITQTQTTVSPIIAPNKAESTNINQQNTTPLQTTKITTKTSPIANISELVSAVTPKNEINKTKPTQIKSKTPIFRYQAICINKVFCLLPLTLDIQQDISQTQLSFLQNVIFARYLEKPIISNRYTYQWPLFQHERAEQGIEIAQSFFKEQLMTHQKELAFDKIWIFGNILEILEINEQTLNKRIKDTTTITLPTLEQSMHSAVAKQSLWQLIK